MLIDVRKLNGIYLVCGKTDLRRGIDGLARVVTEQYELDPYSKSLFMFCGTRKDRYKALYWDGDGFYCCINESITVDCGGQLIKMKLNGCITKQLTRLLSGWALESSIHPSTP